MVSHIYKFTSECHSQTTPSSGRDNHGLETFLAPSANKQSCNYDTEWSNHYPSLSTLRSKGLSHSKMKWWAIYTNFPYIYIYIYIYISIYICIYIYIYICIVLINVNHVIRVLITIVEWNIAYKDERTHLSYY